ncbi:lysozyme-like domain-containing protein [Mycena albidolilacea]|uniref:Lysozyme-like domain-containing protein n=1 Tax=Mycena albidolilacea TaxID=1033008 RepID=A0AAD6Z7P4_9AGAR|nr:lysozyme-like domain-containing protein [Mycena albidolilacea]
MQPFAKNILTLALALVFLGLVSACTGPAINQAALNLIKTFEGFRASPYIDPTGNPTVGYGHICHKAHCADVHYPFPLSTAHAEALLRSDLKTAQDCITLKTAARVKLNENQYGALVSWAFNEGCGAVTTSTLLKRLNEGQNPNTVIKAELPKWNIGGGHPIAGLTRRRAAEVKLALKPSSKQVIPACH